MPRGSSSLSTAAVEKYRQEYFEETDRKEDVVAIGCLVFCCATKGLLLLPNGKVGCFLQHRTIEALFIRDIVDSIHTLPSSRTSGIKVLCRNEIG